VLYYEQQYSMLAEIIITNSTMASTYFGVTCNLSIICQNVWYLNVISIPLLNTLMKMSAEYWIYSATTLSLFMGFKTVVSHIGVNN